jgi:hypothetical protein
MGFYYPDYESSEKTQFTRLGHPGKYLTAYAYTGGQVDFTGSNYGYGAILVATSGGATASLSDGGILPLGLIEGNKDILDISISKISGGTNSVIYVFKKQTGH